MYVVFPIYYNFFLGTYPLNFFYLFLYTIPISDADILAVVLESLCKSLGISHVKLRSSDSSVRHSYAPCVVPFNLACKSRSDPALSAFIGPDVRALYPIDMSLITLRFQVMLSFTVAQGEITFAG